MFHFQIMKAIVTGSKMVDDWRHTMDFLMQLVLIMETNIVISPVLKRMILTCALQR
jgi:hypothetical protein